MHCADGRLVLDEGKRAARLLRYGVHRRRVVVGAEAERTCGWALSGFRSP
jgi:hypothetical protein